MPALQHVRLASSAGAHYVKMRVAVHVNDNGFPMKDQSVLADFFYDRHWCFPLWIIVDSHLVCHAIGAISTLQLIGILIFTMKKNTPEGLKIQ